MQRKALVPGVAALLLAVACSGGGEDEASADAACDPTTTVPESSATTAPPAGGEGADTGGGSGSGSDTGSGEAGGGTDTGSGAAGGAEAGPLDVDLRHPTGVVLRLTSLGFEGDDIVIDAEVINSSRNEVIFHSGNSASDRLRLVDDAGEEYNFVEPEESTAISLAQGETLSGTFAFRGPLRGQPDELLFVVNLAPEEIGDFDPAEESDTTIVPAFLVPLELTWS